MPNEPDIIQKLSADFNVINNISVDFIAVPDPIELRAKSNETIDAELDAYKAINAEFDSNIKPLEVDFGTIYVVSGDCRVLCASTATWNSKPELISSNGYIYIYSDYRKDSNEQNIASFKVGDGTSYLIDMPFTDELLYAHLSNSDIHVTSQDREFWNNKVRCYIDPVDDNNLIFTTH